MAMRRRKRASVTAKTAMYHEGGTSRKYTKTNMAAMNTNIT
jgi:hypothetical protein